MTELEAIKRRCDAATPGPWDSEGSKYVYAQVPGGRPNGEYILHCYCYVKPVATDEANADFIAHARSDVPELVAEVKRLRGLMKRLVYIADNCRGDESEWGYRGYDFVDKIIRKALGEG